MINESKQAIKQIFDNFDKDHSGFVDSGELIAISKELNSEMSQEEVNKLMKVVDVNKDGKISFQEFWDWWQYGKMGKLEKLVFMKLKMMNLMKKVHSEFTRFGSSLVQKYDGVKNNHYFAFNYGETLGHIRLKANYFFKGTNIQNEINQFITQTSVKEEKNPQIVLIIKCEDPPNTLKKFKEYYAWLQNQLEEVTEDNPLAQFFAKDQDSQVLFETKQNDLIVIIKLVHPFMQEWIEEQLMPVVTAMGQQVDVTFEMNAGIKNGCKKLITKNLQFVKWLMEGFLVESHLNMNKDFIKNIFNVLLLKMQNLFTIKQEKKRFYQYMLFPFLLRSSKIHFTFKNTEDVGDAFRALGLEDLLEDQPSGRELLEELIPEDKIQDLKEQENEDYLIYKLIKLMQECLIAQGTISFIVPHQFTHIQFSCDGLKEIFDVILRDEPEKQTK